MTPKTGHCVKSFCFLLVLTLAFAACNDDSTVDVSSGLQVGFAHEDITPTVPVMLAGYGAAFFSERSGRWSTGVHDPLYARAMAVEDPEGTPLLLIVLDSVGIITNEVVEIQNALASYLGIPPDHVVVSSTHTHHGPDTIGIWGVIVPPISGRQEEVIDKMVAGAVRAGIRAWTDRTPARLTYGTGEEPRVHMNKIFTDFKRVLDSTMTVITAYGSEGNVIGSLMNWPAHPTLLPESNTLISADFPGTYCNIMAARVGGEHVFVNGAIGASVQAIAPEEGWIKWLFGSATWADVDAMGEVLADTATSIMAVSSPMEVPTVHRLQEGVIEVAMENVLFAGLGRLGLIPRTLPPLGESAQTYVTTFALGPVTFGTVPGEFAPDYSLRMRDIMGGSAQVIIGLGMDWIGYAITPEQYRNLSYIYEMFLCPNPMVGEEVMAFYESAWTGF